MSWDFVNTKTVNGRKEYRCEQCHTPIEAGTAHIYVAGKVEGDFMDYREHSDCREACLAHDDCRERDMGYGEGYIFLADDDDRDDAWLQEHYPAVAERLGLPNTAEA